MACFWLHRYNTNISIPQVEEVDGVVFYCIDIRVGSISWRVIHRYNDFYELHQQIVLDHGVSKDMLPPKKVIMNKCPVFIEKRRIALEVYLNKVFNYLQRTMPRLILQFLDFHEYDVYFLLQNLAMEFYLEGDRLLGSTKEYSFNVLQLHAISKCCKGPYPEVEDVDHRCDFSHVLDVCSQLYHLRIEGIWHKYKNSNFIPNDLSFDLTCFKSLQTLEASYVTFDNVNSLGNLRAILKKMKINHTPTSCVSQILLCDTIHKASLTKNQIWHSIEDIDLSNNSITTIDAAIHLVPGIRSLNLTGNRIKDITNLSGLTNLSRLVLSANLITNCDSLHTKLGNVVHIDMSQNLITTLCCFDKLYSLEYLDVSNNHIRSVDEIRYVGSLPCLENLRLTGNPVAITVDYRVKVLEHFGARAADVYLDNERATQKEMDTAFILQALRIVKEGKTPHLLATDN